jgi:putative ABC transport system substrate-binding protein
MSGRMRRREFMTLLGGMAAAWPLAARAQLAAKVARIGIVDNTARWDAFRLALRDLGYIEGQNVKFEYRYGEGTPARLTAAASELAHLPVDVIATFGTPASRAAKQATAIVPIVMIGIGDPISAGLVTNIARPEGNITGFSGLSSDTVTKGIQFFREIVPTIRRLAFLWNPDNASNRAQLEALRKIAPSVGITLISVEVSIAANLENAFASMVRERPNAVTMTGDPFLGRHREWIIDFLITHKLPGMMQLKEDVAAGGLMSYGASLPDLFRRGAGYVHKILEGAKPGDLPVEQPTKFELTINLKTAKALGLDVSPILLAGADEVIE